MFWKRVTRLTLRVLRIGRALFAQADRGRNFVQLDHALLDQFGTTLEKIDRDVPADVRRTAELIVRDFKAAGSVDEEALAALGDWITDAIYFANLDLAEFADALRLAAQRLIDDWEDGDVAGAFLALKTTVAKATSAQGQ